MYPLLAVANLIIENHQEKIIPSFCEQKLQKLLFLSEAWSYKIHNEPVTDDFFSLWQTGPVNAWLYHKLKYYKSNTINNFISLAHLIDNEYTVNYMIVPETDKETRALIQKVISVYGDLRPSQLTYFALKVTENLSLQEGSVLNKNHFEIMNLKPNF